MQTEASPYQYRGMFHALSTVLREEGARALYKGWLPSVIGVVSNILIIYFLFIKMMIMLMILKMDYNKCKHALITIFMGIGN